MVIPRGSKRYGVFYTFDPGSGRLKNSDYWPIIKLSINGTNYTPASQITITNPEPGKYLYEYVVGVDEANPGDQIMEEIKARVNGLEGLIGAMIPVATECGTATPATEWTDQPGKVSDATPPTPEWGPDTHPSPTPQGPGWGDPAGTMPGATPPTPEWGPDTHPTPKPPTVSW